ncbi:hypothetical protein HNR44_000508 [Geomicrobium halophilum]|uniref:YfhE-like protein n=1 Tax=Geomicrobium halophilum TaxID=549000 RepID=A0A841PIJ2_9BACL|nr:YfhE family protein [Geomicrobium halophilum]MBB6448559.1 hypothetical protein [Geomicrobium halophilum]
MEENKEPHKQMTDKNNGLNSAQEVTYSEEFKKADKANKDKHEKK